MPYKPKGKICEGCNKPYMAKDHRTRFCSYKCYFEWAKSENHSQWKGDKVGIDALHTAMRKQVPKPEFCENCKCVPPRDLANISGKYKRDPSDWKWLCRKCHMMEDGRLNRFIESAPRNGNSPKRKRQRCVFCKILFKPKRKRAKYCSSICSGKHRTQMAHENKNI